MASITVVETRPEGDIADGAAYFESSTNKFVVYDATNASWLAFASDGVGTYSFNISVYANEQAVADIGLTSTVTEGDIVYAQDTDSLYIANADTNWLKFTYDS